jgi:hypothetical protein
LASSAVRENLLPMCRRSTPTWRTLRSLECDGAIFRPFFF